MDDLDNMRNDIDNFKDLAVFNIIVEMTDEFSQFWNSISDHEFKQIFRLSKQTFEFSHHLMRLPPLPKRRVSLMKFKSKHNWLLDSIKKNILNLFKI